MENGGLKDREALPPPPSEMTMEHGGPNYGTGGGCLYLGRYVVTRFGDIYDLETRKQLRMTGGDELIACKDGKVILFRSGDFYSYDLKEGQLAKMDQPGKWLLLLKGGPLSRPAEVSPDGTMSVVDAADSHPVGLGGQEDQAVRFWIGGAAGSRRRQVEPLHARRKAAKPWATDFFAKSLRKRTCNRRRPRSGSTTNASLRNAAMASW